MGMNTLINIYMWIMIPLGILGALFMLCYFVVLVVNIVDDIRYARRRRKK